MAPSGQQDTKAGFAVAKRNFKSAVTRNKIKRLMREAYRLQNKKYRGRKKNLYPSFYLYREEMWLSFKTIDKPSGDFEKITPLTELTSTN